MFKIGVKWLRKLNWERLRFARDLNQFWALCHNKINRRNSFKKCPYVGARKIGFCYQNILNPPIHDHKRNTLFTNLNLVELKMRYVRGEIEYSRVLHHKRRWWWYSSFLFFRLQKGMQQKISIMITIVLLFFQDAQIKEVRKALNSHMKEMTAVQKQLTAMVREQHVG